MSETKHTPGPWSYGPSTLYDRGFYINHSRDTNDIATTVNSRVRHVAETEANARLIAAAPELLAACASARGALHRAAEDRYDVTPQWLLDAVDELVKAIAKAEGRE